MIWLVATALAHDVRPAVVSLTEHDPGRFELRITPGFDGGRAARPNIRWPTGCHADGPSLRCREALAGSLTLESSVVTVVQIASEDGEIERHVARPGQTRLRLGAPRPLALIGEGMAHVLGGLDHLWFVAGLALVAGHGTRPGRRLLAAVTAFTVAHSLTLILVASGVPGPRGAAVELCIAASILLVAREATGSGGTLTRRFPALVAFGVGLVHGLGFAEGFRSAD
ncbi:MAG: HupE/UreJ family protein, partial [Myxococcota bacterium]